MRTLALLFLMWSQTVIASEQWMVANLGSYHMERNGYCEGNFGIGAEIGGERTRLVFGTFQNSLCRNSTYIGVSYCALKYGSFCLGGALAGFTGYDKSSGKNQREDKVILAPLPVISYERKTWGANILLIPPHDEFGGAVGAQLKFKWH